MAKYQIKNSQNHQYYWVFRASNHEIVLTSSETYTTKQNTLGSIISSKSNINDNNFQKGISSDGQYNFVQKAKNGEEIGISERYRNSSDRDNGIKVIQRESPGGTVEDLTGTYVQQITI